MRKILRYIKYVLIILFFIVFNYILLSSLKENKIVQEPIKPKIMLISHVYSNPYWQYVKLGAEAAAKKRDAVIDFEGPDEPNVDESIKLINMAYAAKVSGIITYVQDEDKYKPIIDKAVNAGIPVVTVDSDAENSKRLTYIGTDNIAAGCAGAKEMIKQIGAYGKVGIIMGGKNAKNQIERVKGFTDYITSHSSLAIEAIESSDSYLLEAELSAKKILMSNSDIKALFCTSALDGQGAAKTLTSLGFSERVKIICFDDLPETLDDINNGIITSTIAQKPYLMGYKAVNVIMDTLKGKETENTFFTDIAIVNKENVDQYKVKQGDYNSENK